MPTCLSGRAVLSLGLLVYVAAVILAAGAIIYIDDLEEGTFSLTVHTNKQTDSKINSGLDLGRVLGGRRDSDLNYIQGAGTESSADNTTYPGDLYYQSPPSASAWLRLQYGVAGDMNSDLTAGGVNDGIYLRYKWTDPSSGTCRITVVSSSGSYTVAKPTPADVGATGTLVKYAFSEFPGVDFSDVDQLTIIWTNMPPNFDFMVTFFAAGNEQDFVIPEPQSFSLLAFSGLLLLRRLSRRAP